MKKTLGGDRLGSGKKMSVELHNYERSTHDLGYLWRTSMAAGTLVPFLVEVALPGDTFDIDLNCIVMTHPTLGPLFGSYKTQLDVFMAPFRLYHAALHNNRLGIGLNMSTILLPQIQLQPTQYTASNDLDNMQVNPSCILSYLGIRGAGITLVPEEPTPRNFNAIPLLAYADIYKNYYANKQEEIGAIVTVAPAPIETVTTITVNGTDLDTPPSSSNLPFNSAGQIIINYTGTTPFTNLAAILFNTAEHGQVTALQLCASWVDNDAGEITSVGGSILGAVTLINWTYANVNQQIAITTFALSYIDNMRDNILQSPPFDQFLINNDFPDPYGTALQPGDTQMSSYSSQCGLLLKTYQSDLFNNWLNTETIDGTGGITDITAIDTTGGSFTIDTLNLAHKVYNMLNRIAISGGSYDDWLDAVYTHERYTRCESPMYMGGLSKELVFQQVISLAQANDQPLGTLGGRGQMGQKHKGGKIIVKCDEPSYIMGIVSLTPRIDYSQGNRWDTGLNTMDDLHKPALDEIGFQELITEQMAWWDTWWDTTTSTWVQNSAGKQPAWINYMTNYNRTYGNFAIQNNEMFMTLNRRYEATIANLGTAEAITDLTTYIDPTKYNFIFAQTSLDAQNFWVQIAVDMTARRKMSAKVIPNL